MQLLKLLAGAIVRGILLALSMPPIGIGWLGWISLVPLLVAIPGNKRSMVAAAGFLAASVASILLETGLVPAPNPMDGEANWIFGGYCLFGLLLAFVCYEVSGQGSLTHRKVAYLAALAVCLELALGIVLPVHLALSQYRLPGAMWLSSICGIWAVSYVVWSTMLLIAKFIVGSRGRLWPYAVWAVGIGAICIVPWPVSVARFHGPKIAVVQTQSVDASDIAGLNLRAGNEGATLTIWPELSANAMVSFGDTSELKKLSLQKNQPPFVAGFEDGIRPKPHNVVALFEKGVESIEYFKRKPFGAEQLMHQAGDKPAVAQWTVPVGLNICFDSCYPWVMRDTVALGAAFIALPTEDPPSKNGIVQALHSAYMPFRSAELGVPIYRADITAYSTVTDSNGRILAELDTGQGMLVYPLPGSHDTIYRHLGDWFLYLCFVLVSWTFLAEWVNRRQQKERRTQSEPNGALDPGLSS